VLTDVNNCGACGTRCAAGQACANGFCVGGGTLRITATWDRPGDVDLHVVTPDGSEIYWNNASGQGGTLDRDDTTGTGPENIFWSAAAPAGTYLVCVAPYAITGATNFTVTANRPSYPVITFAGSRATSTGNQVCSRTSPSFVGAFSHP
jgi:hypothetical protein